MLGTVTNHLTYLTLGVYNSRERQRRNMYSLTRISMLNLSETSALYCVRKLHETFLDWLKKNYLRPCGKSVNMCWGQEFILVSLYQITQMLFCWKDVERYYCTDLHDKEGGCCDEYRDHWRTAMRTGRSWVLYSVQKFQYQDNPLTWSLDTETWWNSWQFVLLITNAYMSSQKTVKVQCLAHHLPSPSYQQHLGGGQLLLPLLHLQNVT